MINIFQKFKKKFNELPKEVRVIFYIGLNGFVLLLLRDFEELKGVNEYLDILIMMVVNLLAYLSLSIKKEIEN